MKVARWTLALGMLLAATTIARAQDNCPWDATGPGIVRDCQVTYGFSGDVKWWEYDVEACWKVSPDNTASALYHQYGHFFPRCDVDMDGYISMDDVVDICNHMGECPAAAHELEYLVGYGTNSMVQLVFKGQFGVTDGYRIAYKQGSMPEDCSGDDGSTVYIETNPFANTFIIDQPAGDIYARVCSYSDVACNASPGLTVQPKNLEATSHTQCIAENLESIQTKHVALYLALFAENPHLIETIGLCEQSAAHQELFWSSLDQTEIQGAPIDVPTPPEYQPFDPDYSAPELWWWYAEDLIETVLAAKQSWAFYLELHRVFSWSILDYDPALLDRLLNEYYLDNRVVEFSIADTYGVAIAQLPGGQSFTGNAREATVHIVDLARQLRHGVDSNPLRHIPVTVEDVLNENMPAEYFDQNYYISRTGCGFTARFLSRLTTALNIPSFGAVGYLPNHSSWEAPTVDAVLIHGDDVYNDTYELVPTDELLDSYVRLQNEAIIPHGQYSAETKWHAKAHYARIVAKYPSQSLVDIFCGDSQGICPESAHWEGIRNHRYGFYLDPNVTQETCPNWTLPNLDPGHPHTCQHTWYPELLSDLYDKLCVLAPGCHPGCTESEFSSIYL